MFHSTLFSTPSSASSSFFSVKTNCCRFPFFSNSAFSPTIHHLLSLFREKKNTIYSNESYLSFGLYTFGRIFYVCSYFCIPRNLCLFWSGISKTTAAAFRYFHHIVDVTQFNSIFPFFNTHFANYVCPSLSLCVFNLCLCLFTDIINT